MKLPIVGKRVIRVRDWTHRLGIISSMDREHHVVLSDCHAVSFRNGEAQIDTIWIPSFVRNDVASVLVPVGKMFGKKKLHFPKGGALGFMWSDHSAHYYGDVLMGDRYEPILIWKLLKLWELGEPIPNIDIGKPASEELDRVNLMVARAKLETATA